MLGKRIWHLLSNPWNSAITEYALSSAQALSLSGFQNFFTALSGSPAEKRATALNLETFSIDGFTPRYYFKLKTLAKHLMPDYIFVYGGKETAFTRLLGHPRVIRFRGDARDVNFKPEGLYYNLTQKHLAGLFFPCNLIASSFSSSNLPKKVIPLGLDPEKFKIFPSNTEKNRLNIHLIARFDPIKGHKKFFKLFSILLKEWNQKQKPFLNIMGQEEGITTKEMCLFADSYGLMKGRDYQITPYRVDNIQNVMSQSDLIVIPSEGSEVICRVAEESLMCGSPVLVSGAGALDEVLKEKIFGASYKGFEEKESTELLLNTLESSSKETNTEKTNRSKLAQEIFSLKKMGENFKNFLLELS